MVALQLAGPFLPFDTRPAVSAAAALVFATGFPLMSGSFRIAALLFLALGSALLAFGRSPLSVWTAAIASMTNIVCIVAVMQTFSIPIRLGDYNEAIRSWLGRRFKGRRSLFLFTTFATHLLTSFLNLGSIPILVSLLRDALERRVPQHRRFFAAAATRGYVLAALWSPGAVNLFLVVQATGLSWSAVALPGFLLALFGMVLSFLLESRKGGILDPAPAATTEVTVGPEEAGAAPPPVSGSKSRAWHVVLVAAAFVLAVVLLEGLGIGTSSGRILMAGLMTASLWLISLARLPGLPSILRSYWTEGLLKTADIAPFFVAMGLFSGALENSGAMGFVGPVIEEASVFLGAATVVPIGLLIILGSLIGLHPFITIVLFGKMLMHASLPVPTLTVALSLAVGGAAAYMVSPFAGVIMTVSKLIGAKASDVAIRWNWRFGLSFYATGMVFAFAWGAVFG